MQKFTIDCEHLVGFANETSPIGQTTVEVQTKCELITSDKLKFHVWMSHITQIFLAKANINPLLTYKFLILIHKNNTADIYVNDFREQALVTIKQPAKIGEAVPLSNVSDISELRFPEIVIEASDAIIYCQRTDWRFSLYYDFNRKIDVKVLSKELGELTKEAKFHTLISSTESEINEAELDDFKCVIFTEGKTDIKHLETAYKKLGLKLNIAFAVSDGTVGSKDLLKMCEHISSLPQKTKVIFIFDRDEPGIIQKLDEKGTSNGFQYWGNNTYSFYLPQPSHRPDEQYATCIELFYSDSDLLRKDANGRRMYLTNEFDQDSGAHKSESLHYLRTGKLKESKIKIIDSDVFEGAKSVAMTKDDFAEAIKNEDPNFKGIDFKEFAKVYDIIELIIKHKKPSKILDVLKGLTQS